MRIAQAQGKDWTRDLYKSLLTYRSTPHESTGETPAKLMFHREIRTKLPEICERSLSDVSARDRNTECKQKGKDYADSRRNAKENDLTIGDQVLMQQTKQNKLSTRYGEKPLTIVDKNGSKVVVKTESGQQYTRNSAHLKKFVTPEETHDVIEVEPQVPDNNVVEKLAKESESSIPTTPIKETRTGRRINTPARFQDFEMS